MAQALFFNKRNIRRRLTQVFLEYFARNKTCYKIRMIPGAGTFLLDVVIWRPHAYFEAAGRSGEVL